MTRPFKDPGPFVIVFVFVFVFGERVETAVGSSGQLAPAELITPPLTRLLHCLLIQGTAIVSLPPSPTSRQSAMHCTMYGVKLRTSIQEEMQ